MIAFNFMALSFTLFITNTVAPRVTGSFNFQGFCTTDQLSNDEIMQFDSIKNQFYLRDPLISTIPRVAVRIPHDYVQLAASGENIVNIRIPMTFLRDARTILSPDSDHNDSLDYCIPVMDVVKLGSDRRDILSELISVRDNGGADSWDLELVRITFDNKKKSDDEVENFGLENAQDRPNENRTKDVESPKLMPFVIIAVILLIIGVIVFGVLMISPKKTDNQQQGTKSVV